MAELSTAAQAVLDAVYEYKDPMGEDGPVIAAALRAAADQCTDGAAHRKMYAIAAELEGTNG